MTKKRTVNPIVKRGGGVYVNGKRVEWTKPASTEAHDKRVAEREARKTIKQKETDDGR